MYLCHDVIMQKFPISRGLLMSASSNGNTSRVTSPLCGEFTDHRWIPHTKAKEWRRRWLETPSCSLYDVTVMWHEWSIHPTSPDPRLQRPPNAQRHFEQSGLERIVRRLWCFLGLDTWWTKQTLSRLDQILHHSKWVRKWNLKQICKLAIIKFTLGPEWYVYKISTVTCV